MTCRKDFVPFHYKNYKETFAFYLKTPQTLHKTIQTFSRCEHFLLRRRLGRPIRAGWNGSFLHIRPSELSCWPWFSRSGRSLPLSQPLTLKTQPKSFSAAPCWTTCPFLERLPLTRVRSGQEQRHRSHNFASVNHRRVSAATLSSPEGLIQIEHHIFRARSPQPRTVRDCAARQQVHPH